MKQKKKLEVSTAKQHYNHALNVKDVIKSISQISTLKQLFTQLSPDGNHKVFSDVLADRRQYSQ